MPLTLAPSHGAPWPTYSFPLALLLLLALCAPPGAAQLSCGAITNGGLMTRSVTLSAADSPCVVKADLTVPQRYALTVGAGVQLRFNPGTTLFVNGTLLLKGEPNNRVVLTKNSPALPSGPGSASFAAPVWPDDIRLVDDFSVDRGRLQVKYKAKWRGICANFQNWTQTDVNVACVQLGFLTGNFSFLPWAVNDSLYMLYERPACLGTELSVLNCPTAQNIRIGSRICRNQRTIWLRCYGLSPRSPSLDNWSGIEMYNSTTATVISGVTKINESASSFSYADILFAGVDSAGRPLPAVRASPYVPAMHNVTIRYCALDATNFTEVRSSTKVTSSWLNSNRGHGLAVETNLGHVVVKDSLMDENQGNGVKVKFLDSHYYLFDDLLTFCRMSNLDRQTFPQTIIGIPYLTSSCTRKFETQMSDRLTLNVLEMDIEPSYTARLDVYDGRDDSRNSPLLASYDIINGTLPMGVTSTFYYMYIRFSWVKGPSGNYPPYCPTLRDCVKFTIQIDSAVESSPEFFMNATTVHSNLQHGVFLENARNYLIVNASSIKYNGYGAGIRVYGGAGDVLVNASQVEYNQDNGVNITYDGGWKIFNGSTFSHNYGNGVNITTNETSVDNRTRYTRHQRTEVSRSYFINNDGHGVRVGNYCRSGLVAINDSTFSYNGRAAVELESCYRIAPDANSTNMTVAYNRFRANREHGVKISPLLNAVGTIANNSFVGHEKYTLLVDNTDDLVLNDEIFRLLRVEYSIITNTFDGNGGQYVAKLRLTQGAPRQRMNVSYNMLRGNVITGANPTLNERTRAYAVVILSSSNVNLSRNHIENPASEYEIATHLLEMSVNLQAQRNWWGTTDYSLIVPRIFDQLSRYNLARILYHPALSFDWLYTPVVTDRNMEMEIPFQRGNVLGGRLATELRLTPGATYTVDRDITILNWGTLYISPGTTLEFGNCLGALVEGKVEIAGAEAGQGGRIFFRLANQSTWFNNSRVRLVGVPSWGAGGSQGGDEAWGPELEGRLEVRPNDTDDWGTVCSEGWTMQDASVACQMLGLAAHPSSWRVLDPSAPPGGAGQPIYRSQVRCGPLDRDLLECDAEDESGHSCVHSQDVRVRCTRPTWAGVRLLATARASQLSHVTLSEAGLLDAAAMLYGPALRVDYNVHALDHVVVEDSSADGVVIMHNDVYTKARLSNSVVRRSGGNGLTLRSSFFELYNCTLDSNAGIGLEYDPSLSAQEGIQIRAGVRDSVLFNQTLAIRLNDNEVRWVTTPERHDAGTVTYELEVEVSTRYKVVMDLIDYLPTPGLETVTVFDTRRSSIVASTTRWQIDRDALEFPIVSQLAVLTVRWTVIDASSGRLTFVLRSRPMEWAFPFPVLRVINSTVYNNSHGILTRHHSQPSDFRLGLFLRYRWETVRLYGTTLRSNAYAALVARSQTKYDPLYPPSYVELGGRDGPGGAAGTGGDAGEAGVRIAEVQYEVEGCEVRDNGGGVSAVHDQLEFSNNVWIWQVYNNRFEGNRGGGLTLELPRVNLMYTELFNHSIDVNETYFIDNRNFEFRIDGFYCNASVASNRFQGNQCRVGCITIAGTEKDFELSDNEVVENQGKYMVLLNMDSHTPYTRWVDARVQYNNIKRNRRPPDPAGAPPTPTSRPTTFAVGVRGLQNVTVNRNLLSNAGGLDFELLGGQSSSLLENYLDVTENWWGTTDQAEIRERIFDFDDWNSFAIAEFYPFLTADSFSAKPFTGVKLRPITDLSQPLGGRVTSDLRLARRAAPYVVRSDLTVMAGVSLIIDAGVEIQFYPSVGVLVLGSLVADGTPELPVKFGPIPRTQYKTRRLARSADLPVRVVRDAVPPAKHFTALTRIHHPDINPLLGYQVRLSGGASADEGFIEIYNTTERRWALVCDRSFNEFTAEVACRTMGKEPSNVIVRTNAYYDIFVLGYPKMHEQVIEWFWRESLVCDGTEAALDQCRYRLNYNLYQCMFERNYVFVRCGKRNLPPEYDYWGNIRFSAVNYENADITLGYNILDNVDIYGAGRLHDDKVAAIQSIYRVPESSHVRVHHCAGSGYDYIAPRDQFYLTHGAIENNNGYAVGALILNGETSSQRESQFSPLVTSGVPYNVYSLLRMCTTEKLVYIKDRALLYHKYDFTTIDCIKVLRSKEQNKQIAVRFLQVNIFNDTYYKNAVEMYNGEYFDYRQLIGQLTANSTQYERRLQYHTSPFYDTMGIRVTGSPADGGYGFIAEVVTLPLSPTWRPDLGGGKQQRIAYTSMTDNQLGGFVFKNVGENNLRMTFESNSIQRCGVRILNNTEPGVIDIYIQNTRLLTISNNYLDHNAAGISVNTTTKDNEVAIYANVTNNVITHCSHGEALHLEGHQYQYFDVRYNYIANNDVAYRNIFGAFGVQLNFTSNVVYRNTAQCILNASVLEKISINQRYVRNAIYDNYAFAYNRSTIFLKSAKFEFTANFLVNPYNVYEMVTYNRTKYPDGTYPSVNARNNWWGRGHASYIGGRIWERRDDDNLIRVEYEPFLPDNSSVLDGKCYPGWRQYDNKCYWYFGGVVTYAQAESICKVNKGRLAWARDPRGQERSLGELVAQFQFNYDVAWRVWVYTDWQPGEGRCTVLRDYRVDQAGCYTLLPFICERDPFIVPHMNWLPIIVTLVIVGAVLLFVLLPLLVLACLKSTLRRDEKVERKEVLVRSLHASRASLASLGGGLGGMSKSLQSLKSLGGGDISWGGGHEEAQALGQPR